MNATHQPDIEATDRMALIAEIDGLAVCVNAHYKDMTKDGKARAIQLAHALAAVRTRLTTIDDADVPTS